MAKLADHKIIEGESLSETFRTDVAVTAVSVTLKSGSASVTISATKTANGVFDFSASAAALAGLVGLVRWVAIATSPAGTFQVGYGRIAICPLVSRWREYVTAIDAAIETWGNNPNQTVTIGEVSITAKTLSDLVSLRDTYSARAAAEEEGRAFDSGPRIMRTVFR